MKRLRFLEALVLGIIVLLTLAPANAASAAIKSVGDDFNRSDGPVGNGWSDSTDNMDGTEVIRGQELSTSGTGCTVGIFRPMSFSGIVTVAAPITEENGYSGFLRRYTTLFLFKNDGTLNGGYGIEFYRADSEYTDSAIVRTYNGTQIDSTLTPFQFDSAIYVTVSVYPDGSVTGVLISGDKNWGFKLPAYNLNGLLGTNFAIQQGCPDPRSPQITYPTIDDISISYNAGPISLAFPLQDKKQCGGAKCSPYTAPIASIFDHHMQKAYQNDQNVVALEEDAGTIPDSKDPTCMNDGSGKPYLRRKVNGKSLNYVGASSCAGTFDLTYDDHPGYDYPVHNGTEVYAAESGTLSWSECPTDGTACTDYGRLCVLSSSGYVVGYLHLSRQVGGLEVGTPITKGALIGYSGHTSPPKSPVGPHLHFEVRANRNCVPQSGKAAGDPVDPYGWWGEGEDVYTQLHLGTINRWLWDY